MRAIAASVLVFEAIVVVLAVPVAISLGDVDATVAGIGGATLVLACLIAAAMLRSTAGYALGWVIQVALVLSGFVVTAMFIVGGLFAVLWVVGLRVGKRGEQLRAERWATAGDPGPDGSAATS